MPNIALNLIVDGDRDRAELKAWFDQIWVDETLFAYTVLSHTDLSRGTGKVASELLYVAQ